MDPFKNQNRYEDQKWKLSAIIAEINAAHGKNFDVVTKNAF
jgi:hypothetical protein